MAHRAFSVAIRKKGLKAFHTECLPADGGSIVGSNFRFALRRINNLREVAGEVAEGKLSTTENTVKIVGLLRVLCELISVPSV